MTKIVIIDNIQKYNIKIRNSTKYSLKMISVMLYTQSQL